MISSDQLISMQSTPGVCPQSDDSLSFLQMLDILSNQAHMLDEHVNRLIDHTKDWVNTFNEVKRL